MIYRYMYKGYPKSDSIKVKDATVANNISVFKYGEAVLVYAESERDDLMCEDIIAGDFKEYPDGRLWENLTDIFHYSVPQSDEDWKRKMPKEPLLRVNKLRREKVSSYVFYHYQYQEEKPCDGDKYGVVFISGDMIFMYLEAPEEYAKKYPGTLNTSASPVKDDWAKLMNQHFDMSFSKGKWLEVERIL